MQAAAAAALLPLARALGPLGAQTLLLPLLPPLLGEASANPNSNPTTPTPTLALALTRCPVTYHYKCIPNGHPKPRKCDACRQKKGGKARAGETRDCDQCPEWRCPCSVLVGGVWQLRPPS